MENLLSSVAKLFSPDIGCTVLKAVRRFKKKNIFPRTPYRKKYLNSDSIHFCRVKNLKENKQKINALQ